MHSQIIYALFPPRYLAYVAICIALIQEITKKENTEDVQKCTSAPAESSELQEEILFNPNVFTEFKLAGNPKVTWIFTL